MEALDTRPVEYQPNVASRALHGPTTFIGYPELSVARWYV